MVLTTHTNNTAGRCNTCATPSHLDPATVARTVPEDGAKGLLGVLREPRRVQTWVVVVVVVVVCEYMRLI